MHTLTPADRELAASIARAIPLEPIRALEGAVLRKVLNVRAQWDAVGKFMQLGADECKDCGYCTSFEGAPGEPMVGCALGSRPFHKPMDCPALQADVNEGEEA